MRRILSVRNDKELTMLRKYGIATALNTTLWSGIPLLVAFRLVLSPLGARSESNNCLNFPFQFFRGCGVRHSSAAYERRYLSCAQLIQLVCL
jgi:hypothetical protein